MFGTMSGSVLTVNLLLEAGAKVSATNRNGRTAAQLGAFVGKCPVFNRTSLWFTSCQIFLNVCNLFTCCTLKLSSSNYCVLLSVGHQACVTAINNFLSMKELEYYTKPHGM